MPEEKPVVVVSHAFINNKPKVLVALYLDSDATEESTDANGRRKVVASFEPDAAYVTLGRKIKEARESLRQSAGVTDYITPYLSIATLCDNILHESDGVVSLIRLADIYHFTSDPQLSDPNMALLLKGLLQFRGGPESFEIRILVSGPREERLFSAPAQITLNGGGHSFSVKMEFAIAVRIEGVYRLDVFREDEQLARIPFQIRRTPHQPTPLPSQPIQS